MSLNNNILLLFRPFSSKKNLPPPLAHYIIYKKLLVLMLLSNQEKIDQIGSARYVDNLSSGHVPILFLHRMDMIIKFMCWPAGT